MKKFSVATFNLLNLNEPGLPIYKEPPVHFLRMPPQVEGGDGFVSRALV
jgi:hypothetical protein